MQGSINYKVRSVLIFLCWIISMSAIAQPGWKDITPAGYFGQFSDIHFVDAYTGYLIGNKGTILKTTDGGNTWTGQPNPYSWDSYNTWYYGIHFPTATTGYVVGKEGVIVKTTNGGTTWVKQISNTTAELLAVHFRDVNVGYVAGGNGTILATTDGGIHWRSVPNPYSGSSGLFTTIRFFDHLIGFVAGARDGIGTIFKTIDGGATWTALPPPGNSIAVHEYTDIDVVSADVVVATGSVSARVVYDGVPGNIPYGVIRTTNGGQTWEIMETSARRPAEAIHFTTPQNGFAVSNDEVGTTDDGGLTWTWEDKNPFPSNDLEFYDVHFPQTNRGYVAGKKVQRFTGGVVTAPTTLSFPETNSARTLSIVFPDSWSITVDNAWLSVDKSAGTGNTTITVTAQANPLGDSRLGSITLSDGSFAKRSVQIWQDPAPVSLTLSTNNLSFADKGFLPQFFDIQANATTTVKAEDEWIFVGTVAAEFGDRTIELRTLDNPMAFPRKGIVTVQAGNQTRQITITQAATIPSLSVDRSAIGIDATGGNATFTIKSNTRWKIESEQDWFTVSPSEGIGDASIEVNTTNINDDVYPVLGTLRIVAGNLIETVAVSQIGAPLIFSVSTTSLSLSASYTEQKIAITTNGYWEVFEESPWVTVTPSSGKGSANLTIKVSENATAGLRATNVRVGIRNTEEEANINISQLRSYLSTSQLSFKATGGSETIQITNGGNWTLTSSDPWISVSPANGTGATIATVTATHASSDAQRSGIVTLTFAGTRTQTLSVHQEGAVLQADLEGILTSPGGEAHAVNVTANVPWQMQSPDNWISVSSAFGEGNATVSIISQPLVGTACTRTGSVTLTAGPIERKITITQSHPQPLQPSVTASGPLVFCEGGSVTLQGPSGFAAYTWSDGSKGQSRTVEKSGNYTLTVTNELGCNSVPSQAVVVNTYPLPPSPTGIELLADGYLQVIGNASLYEWYRDNELLKVQTPQIKISEPGVYTVRAIDLRGCYSSLAATYVYIPTALEENLKHPVSIYPNPSSGSFYIQATTPFNDASVMIYNADGKLVFEDAINEADSRLTFNLHHLTPGMYTVHIQRQDAIIYRRLVLF